MSQVNYDYSEYSTHQLLEFWKNRQDSERLMPLWLINSGRSVDEVCRILREKGYFVFLSNDSTKLFSSSPNFKGSYYYTNLHNSTVSKIEGDHRLILWLCRMGYSWPEVSGLFPENRFCVLAYSESIQVIVKVGPQEYYYIDWNCQTITVNKSSPLLEMVNNLKTMDHSINEAIQFLSRSGFEAYSEVDPKDYYHYLVVPFISALNGKRYLLKARWSRIDQQGLSLLQSGNSKLIKRNPYEGFTCKACFDLWIEGSEGHVVALQLRVAGYQINQVSEVLKEAGYKAEIFHFAGRLSLHVSNITLYEGAKLYNSNKTGFTVYRIDWITGQISFQ